MGKRLFDVMFSFFGLVVLLPLFGVIALLIKLGSEGPVFFRGERVGKDGKLFKIYKFRTMVVDAGKLGGPSTPDDDPRITKAGRFIRKYKIDELPQLINVLKGEMSLVGPRPEVKEYVKIYSEEEKAILSVLPGVTDYASIWNPNEGKVLAGSKDPEKAYMEKIWPEKQRLRLEYAKNHSLWIDFKIILGTLKTIIFR